MRMNAVATRACACVCVSRVRICVKKQCVSGASNDGRALSVQPVSMVCVLGVRARRSVARDYEACARCMAPGVGVSRGASGLMAPSMRARVRGALQLTCLRVDGIIGDLHDVVEQGCVEWFGEVEERRERGLHCCRGGAAPAEV